jgi:DNA polymerase-3 subunit delta
MAGTPADPLAALERSLAKAPPQPVYLVLGSEGLARRRIVARLRNAVAGPDPSPMTMIHARAGETDLTGVLDAARTFPLLGGLRLVHLTAAEDLRPEEVRQLADYATRPQATTCLVIEGEKLPTGGAAPDLLARAERLDCAPPRAWEVPAWLQAEVKRRGLTAAPGVTARLQEILGEDPAALAAALDTLSTFLGARRQVGIEDVEALLTPQAHGSLWDLVQAVEEKDLGRALRLLDAVLEMGEPPEVLLRLLERSRRQLVRGLAAGSRGASPDEKLAAMGVAPKARAAPRLRREILARLDRHHLSEAASGLRRILEADAALKGGIAAAPRTLLGSLLLDLCRGGSISHA